MTIFPSGKGVNVTREVSQPTKETLIKPSLLILRNAKDNEIIDLIYDHASLINSHHLGRRPTGHALGYIHQSRLVASWHTSELSIVICLNKSVIRNPYETKPQNTQPI